ATSRGDRGSQRAPERPRPAGPRGDETVSGGYRPLAGVVMAAGEGTRMRSATPKVLHPLCGRAMVLPVVDALGALPLERIVVVVGHGAERVTKTLQDQVSTDATVVVVAQTEITRRG